MNLRELNILKDEIIDDPISVGYTTMTDIEIVASLKTVNQEIEIPVTSRKVLEWSASNGRLANIGDAINNIELSPEIRSVAEAGKLLITRESTEYRKSDHGTLFDVLVTAGILVQSDKDALDAVGIEVKSRLEELSLKDVRIFEIEQARSI